MAFLLTVLDTLGIPTVILLSLDFFRFGRYGTRTVAVRREIETLPFKVRDKRLVRDVTFLFELAEIEAVHDDEFALASRKGHDIISFARLLMCFIGLPYCLP